MMMTSSSLQFCLTVFVLILLPLPAYCADADPLQDLCIADLSVSISANNFPCKPLSQVTADDFVYDGLRNEANFTDVFGVTSTTGNVLAFPGLNTLGISMNRVDIQPGGINPPHLHPRASEIGVVIKGKILAGIITSKNVYYSKVLTAGQVFVIPRGLVHFQLNVGKGKAHTFTAFNSHLPGAATIPLNLFSASPSIPTEVLTRTFLVGEDVVNSIRSKFALQI